MESMEYAAVATAAAAREYWEIVRPTAATAERTTFPKELNGAAEPAQLEHVTCI